MLHRGGHWLLLCSGLDLVQELHCHLEECLSRNLQARCTPLVSQILDTMKTEQTGGDVAAGGLCPACRSPVCVVCLEL